MFFSIYVPTLPIDVTIQCYTSSNPHKFGGSLHNKVQARNNARPNEEAEPKDNISQGISAPHKLRLAKGSQRQLSKLEQKQIPSDLSEKTKHEDFMYNCTEQKREKCRLHLR